MSWLLVLELVELVLPITSKNIVIGQAMPFWKEEKILGVLTWDFFKYPGIRSDSDMYTFGFSWKIWKSPKPIAPAKDILDYLKEAAEEQGMVEKIQFNTDVKSADWKSTDNCWHIITSKGVR